MSAPGKIHAMAISHYTIVFTPQTWQIFLRLDRKAIGFRSTLIKSVAKLRTGDVLICYLAKTMVWCAALEVRGNSYEDKAHVYTREHHFSQLIDVEPIVLLESPQQISVKCPELWGRLDRFRKADHLKSGWAVTTGLHCSLRAVSENDARLLVSAMHMAGQSTDQFEVIG